MDKHTKEQRRKKMQAVKSKGSRMECLLADALQERGFLFVQNVAEITGKPDFFIKEANLVIFCDSAFFHGKDWEIKKLEIKSNQDFWHKKIEQNIRRDAFVNEKLQSEGLIVLRFWENDIKKNLASCVEKIAEIIALKKVSDC